MDNKSIKYLEQYLTLTPELQQKIEEYAQSHGTEPEVCAWYKDREDFVSDWKAIGYSRKGALELLCGNPNEFMVLPDELGIIRFTI